jgi:hypothetical protein
LALVFVMLATTGLGQPVDGGAGQTPTPQTDDGWLQYCGTANSYRTGDFRGQGFGVKFAPAAYPVRLTTPSVYFDAAAAGRWRLRVYDDDGTGGNPGTVLFDSIVQGNAAGWNDYDITARDLRIGSGSFYVFAYYESVPGQRLGLNNNCTSPNPNWYDADTNYATGHHYVLYTMSNHDLMLRAYVVDILNDVGVTRILAPSGTIDSTTSVTPACSVYNYGRNSQASYNVTMRVGTGYSQTVAVTSHAPGTAQYVAFPASSAWPRGTLAVSCSTALSTDQAAANNARTGSVTVRVIDAQAVAILAPTGTVDSGTVLTPQASVRNNGSASATFYSKLTIGAWADSQQVTLGAGATQTLSFNQWTAAQRGSFAVRCTTRLAGDIVPGNNLATGTVTVRVRDAQATTIVAPTGTVDSGASLMPRASVRNNGSETVSFFTRMTIGAWVDSQTVTLGPGNIQTLNFSQWTAGARGAYAVACSTRLAGDQVPGNDRLAGSVEVAVHDAAVIAIAAPADTIVPSQVVPAAVLSNLGTDRSSTRVFFTVNSSPAYRDSVLLPNGLPFADTTLAFQTWNATVGEYQARCSVALAGDQVAANNAAGRGFSVVQRRLDVAALAIVAPGGHYEPDAPIVPQATLGNPGEIGVSLAANLRLIDAGDNEVYSATLAVAGLAAGRDTTVTFDEWLLPHAEGSYTVRCSVYVAGDADPGNDVAAGAFAVGAGLVPSAWSETPSPVPLEPSGKAVKDGGCLAWDAGRGLLYVAKGNKTGDLHGFNPVDGTWQSLAVMPTGVENKQPYKGAVGVSDNAGHLYATKGNNTQGFWEYWCEGDSWSQLADVPLGPSNKRVKGGTDMVYVDQGDSQYVYLLKGYKTEFYRYNTATGVWQPLPDAPAGALPKWDKGSWLAFDGSAALYAHKAKNHEMYAFDLAAQTWGPALGGMPLANGQTGKSKKAKDGSDGLCVDGVIYALKGGNTQDFYAFDVAGQAWIERETIPAFGSTAKKKKVKAGGSLASDGATLYALKGNKTLELWRYDLGSSVAQAVPRRDGATARGSTLPVPQARLGDCRPNPFSGRTAFAYELATTGLVRLAVHDASGRVVRVLRTGTQAAGRYSAAWDGRDADGRDVANGVYLVRLDAPGCCKVRTTVVMR